MGPRGLLVSVLFVSALAVGSAVASPSEHSGHADTHINWAHGFVGEKDGVEPSLAWRPTGMPPPFLASAFNASVLFFILFWFGRKPVAEGLKRRKERIVAGMDEAGRMKDDASKQLRKYEAALEAVDEEIERVRREMREAADLERERILVEAKERRDRMERDAKLLVQQELKQAHEELVRETVRGAVSSAREIIAKELSSGDQDRLANEYIEQIRKASFQSAGGKA